MVRHRRRKTNNVMKNEEVKTEKTDKTEKTEKIEKVEKPKEEVKTDQVKKTKVKDPVKQKKKYSGKTNETKLNPYYKVCYKNEYDKPRVCKVNFGKFYNLNASYDENLEDAVGDTNESGGFWAEDKDTTVDAGIGVIMSIPKEEYTKRIIPLHKIQYYIPCPESNKKVIENPEKTV